NGTWYNVQKEYSNSEGACVATLPMRSDILELGVGLPTSSTPTTLPLARSNRDGTFAISTPSVGSFAQWAHGNANEVTPFIGDFNRDNITDVALVGGSTWSTLPVAMGHRDGTLTVTNSGVGSFAQSAAVALWRLSGDFNGDGRTDVLLLSSS